MKHYKALIFDWDGTLVDTCGLVLDAHNHVRDYMEQERWTMEDFMGRASQSAREYYPQIYGDRAEEAQTVLYDYVEKHHLGYLQPMEGVQEFLDYLKEIQLPVAIASNKRHQTLLKEVAHLKWDHYFHYLIGAGVAKMDKPSADPLLLAVKELKGTWAPNEILYIGDTETDLLAAQNAQYDCVFIQSDKPRPDLISKYKPPYQYRSFSEFSIDYRGIMEQMPAINS